MADTNQNQNSTTTNVVDDKNTAKVVDDKNATKNETKDKKAKKEKKQRRPFKVVMKTWSKGLGKETSRITWEKKRDVAKDFITIVVIAVILALIFFAIDLIIISIRK